MPLILRNIGYEEGLTLQQQAVDALVQGRGADVLLLLEHEPVFTIGRLRDQSSLHDPQDLPHPAVETNRGGQATYHGPGQLVGYPIFDLRKRGQDLHAHLRLIEDVLIRSCEKFGIEAVRREGFTGVWVAGKKLASIGVGVRKWISMHGFAINVTPECLHPFRHITPCGIDGVIMTCVSEAAGKSISVAEFSDVVEKEFAPHIPN